MVAAKSNSNVNGHQECQQVNRYDTYYAPFYISAVAGVFIAVGNVQDKAGQYKEVTYRNIANVEN